FFFQAEDGIRDYKVTGVQTCALPISFRGSGGLWNGHRVEEVATPEAWDANPTLVWRFYSQRRRDARVAQPNAAHYALAEIEQRRSEERRVGKECRSRWTAYH